MADPITKSHISGRIAEISQHGCFAESENLLPIDSVVQLRVHRSGDVFETWARVVHNRSGIGMGLRFIDTPLDQARLLKGWLEGLQEV
jgi:PilZ domain